MALPDSADQPQRRRTAVPTGRTQTSRRLLTTFAAAIGARYRSYGTGSRQDPPQAAVRDGRHAPGRASVCLDRPCSRRYKGLAKSMPLV
jgi:hypothetical protein